MPPHKRPTAPNGNAPAWLLPVVAAVLVVILGGIWVSRNQTPEPSAAAAPPPPPASGSIDPDLAGLADDASLHASGAPERFAPPTLSDRINGRADLYLRAGFVSLYGQRFALPDQETALVTLLAFDMGTPRNAYTVFGLQRRPDAASVDLGDTAFSSGGSLFVQQGQWYLELVPSAPEDALYEAALRLATAFVAQQDAEDDSGAPPAQLFPEDGRVEGSLVRIPDDAFGCEALDDVWTATYERDGASLLVFAAVRPSPAEAAEAATAYRKFLTETGGTLSPVDDLPDGASVLLMGTTTVVLRQGRVFAGVQEAEDPDAAGALAAAVARGLGAP